MFHKILIVEDDVDDQLFFFEAIASIDPSYECAAVGDGMEALDHLNNTNTLPSIILLDLNMPLMNGYEFLEKVKKIYEFRDIPVIVFSTSTLSNDAEKAKRLGAQRFYTKPRDVKELKQMLIEVLFQRT